MHGWCFLYVKYFCKSINICDLHIEHILTSLRKNGRVVFVVRYERKKVVYFKTDVGVTEKKWEI
jgi:hypothetical protein